MHVHFLLQIVIINSLIFICIILQNRQWKYKYQMLNESNQASSLNCGFGISPWLYLHIFLLCMSGVYEFLDFLCPLGAGLLIVLCFFPILHWPRHFVSAHISSFATNELPHQLTVRFYSSLLFLFLNSRSHITCITLRYPMRRLWKLQL